MKILKIIDILKAYSTIKCGAVEISTFLVIPSNNGIIAFFSFLLFNSGGVLLLA
ncbi:MULTISPECIES: hypothetical protein [unclassified Methanobrevibacter]|uniref:hypothetical protein n=1 Tax=unclassified Methanobrevibacter TaxID=2638681 RepID=UPI0027345117|nr:MULTISPECIES: hypothetical protein [unclassified Methanobrevibacter]